MAHFLIQAQIAKKNNLIPAQEFGYETIKSIDYYKWWDKDSRYNYSLYEKFSVEKKENHSNIFPQNYLTPEYIPVGSVEFVLEFIKQCYRVDSVTPLNIPLELYKFANRKLKIIKNSEFFDHLSPDKEYFIKSATKIKGYTNFVSLSDKVHVPDDLYLVSEVIDIKSEWRCFVKDGELLDIKCYSGNPFIMPSIEIIKEMISEYKTCPPAYTLDVCLDSNGGTSIIECHNFFSCGLYGFNDYKNYLIMLIRAFRWQVELKTIK